MAANPCRKGMLIVGRVQGGPCVECAHGCVRWAWRRGEGRGKGEARREEDGAGEGARCRRAGEKTAVRGGGGTEEGGEEGGREDRKEPREGRKDETV